MHCRTFVLTALFACPALFASYADSAPGVIDTVAPQITMVSVLDAQIVVGTQVYVEYSVSDQSAQAPLVTITAEGAGLSVPVHTTMGYGANFNWPCELELGIYQFHFHVQDACGNAGELWSTEFEVIGEGRCLCGLPTGQLCPFRRTSKPFQSRHGDLLFAGAD